MKSRERERKASNPYLLSSRTHDKGVVATNTVIVRALFPCEVSVKSLETMQIARLASNCCPSRRCYATPGLIDWESRIEDIDF